MRRVTRRSTVLVLLAVIALLGSTVALAASRQFGYDKVRSGLPSGLPNMTVTSTDLRAGKPIPQQFWGCNSAGYRRSCRGGERPRGHRALW